MKKRVFALLLAMVLLICSAQITVFAENEGSTEEKVYGDAVVTVEIGNPDCIEIQKLKDAKLSVVIGLSQEAGYAEEFRSIEIPVQAVNMNMDGEEADLTFWLGYEEKVIEKEFLKYLSDLQGDLFEDMTEDATETIDQVEALLKEVTVDVKGLPEEHYVKSADLSSCAVITNEIIKAIVEFVEEMIGLMYPEMNLDEIEGFTGILDAILAEENTTLDEVIRELAAEDEALAKEIEELFDELDHALIYMQSEEFPGLLIAGAYLECDCPTVEMYDITHEYYKNVNGKLELVGLTIEGEEDIPEGLKGTIIKASDYVKCEYEGVTYKYIGSYNNSIIFEDAYYEYDWSEFELDEFVLGDEEIWGLILRYEIVEEEKAKPEEKVEKEPEKEVNPPVDTPVDNEGKHPVNEKTTVPETADEQNFGLYLLMAAGAMGVIIPRVNRKK